MPRERRKIGDLLLAANVVTEAQLEEALAEQKTTGELVGQVLVRRGWVTEQGICEVLQEQLGLPVVRLEGMEVDEHVLSLVSEELASRHVALPLAVEGQRGGRTSALVVAMADPLNAGAIEDIRFFSGYFVVPGTTRTNGFSGTVLQKHLMGLGYFLGTTQAGSVQLIPGEETPTASPGPSSPDATPGPLNEDTPPSPDADDTGGESAVEGNVGRAGTPTRQVHDVPTPHSRDT